MNFCIAMVMGLGIGCSGGEKAAPAAGEYCQVSETIMASRHDTPETLAQIRRENAKRRKLCNKNSG